MFTHLNVKSGFSLLKSTVKINELVQKAENDGQKAIALTDINVMHGVVPFYQACIAKGIKPIIGLTVMVRHDDNRKDQVVLLAKNDKGYENLIDLATTIGLNKAEEKAISLQELEPLKAGLIGILPFEESSVYFSLQSQQFQDIVQHFKLYEQVFSKDSFFIGITELNTLIKHHTDMLFKQFLKDHHFKACALIDCLYLDADDAYVFDCLQAIREGRVWDGNEDIVALDDRIRHFISKEEAAEIFEKWPELAETTYEIGEMCKVELDFNKRMLPEYPLSNDEKAATYLRSLSFSLAKKKYGNISSVVQERLNHELQVINEMGFSDYFLIVWDFIEFAKNEDIVVGPGRGSSAGSLVSYVLGITNVDPLEYNLLFERFLNPERLTMPDIDIDFEDTRRDEVIHYVRKRYGENHVAQIITFGTFLARSIMRELFKALDVEHDDQKFILDEMTKQGQKPVVQYVHDSKKLRDYVKRSEKLKTMFRIAMKLAGLPRHISTHAAGVIISKESLTKHVPLIQGTHETYLTQYAMNDLEKLGLLKMDFLGLRNLTFLKNVLHSIEETTGTALDIEKIPFDDARTFRLLQRGLTNSIFQLESRGMKQVLRTLKPTRFEDIVAVNALFRPGPMNYIQTYVNRKHQREKPSYPHPDLEPILEETYGVLVYQEQIMQIAHKIAGYSLGEADILRRAVSKKEASVLEGEEAKFIQGCLQNGYTEQVAKELFGWIVKFSNYGFNKSHAVAYSKIAYELSYLKANYPAHFFEQMFNSLGRKQDKLKLYREEAKVFGLQLLAPSVNASIGAYKTDQQNVRMGFEAIQGINQNMSQEIVQERKKNGPYKHIFDFCLRVDLKLIPRKAIENLIMAGAFDEFSQNRKSHLQALDRAIEQGELFREFLGEQNAFSTQLDTSLPKVDNFSSVQLLKEEKELVGIYLSSHPIEAYRLTLTNQGVLSVHQAWKFVDKGRKRGCALIQSVREIRTKDGKQMAFLTLEDETGEMDAVIFPDAYKRIKVYTQEEKIVLLEGVISKRRDRLQWVIHDLKEFASEKRTEEKQRLFIKVAEHKDEQKALQFLQKIALESPGQTAILIHNAATKKNYQLDKPYYISPTEKIMQKLQQYFGMDAVVLK